MFGLLNIFYPLPRVEQHMTRTYMIEILPMHAFYHTLKKILIMLYSVCNNHRHSQDFCLRATRDFGKFFIGEPVKCTLKFSNIGGRVVITLSVHENCCKRGNWNREREPI